MKLHINKDSKPRAYDPVENWIDLIGKNSEEADDLIRRNDWKFCLKSENDGYGVHKCVEYRNIGCRVTLILDENDKVCDVFVFSIAVTPAP